MNNGEHKKAEGALRLSEDRYRLIIETANEGYGEIDLKGRITAVNRRLEEMFGYGPGEMLGLKLIGDLIFPEDQEQMRARMKGRRKGEFLRYEQRFRKKEGGELWTIVSPTLLKDNAGDVRGSFAMITDITEIKKTEALRASEALLTTTLESTADGILVVDSTGRVVHKNNRFQELWRIPREVIDTRDDRTLLEFVTNQLAEPEKFLSKVQALYKSAEEDFDTIWFKDGRVFERYSRPLISDSKISGRVWSFRDVTKRKEEEKALVEQTLELKRLVSELEQYVNVASHDLKAPLRMIASYLQLIAQRCKSKFDEEESKYFSRVIKNAVILQRLIDDLLVYALSDRGERQWKKVDCSDILNQAIENLQFDIEDSHAAITSSPLPVVVGIDTALVQLFQNLIGNAIKFRGTHPLHIHVSAEKKDSDWVFAVQDNGIGIDMKYVDRIFKLFERLHSMGTIEGTGLGLAIAKKVVESHGGRIWVDSKPGTGATFYFTIPVNE